ncbi:MAG: hypothetical protein RBT63_06120, partial [Bdellovibrionales bacterium]|nr:hypothetical protein [Bdellovibrionales bacterium]
MCALIFLGLVFLSGCSNSADDGLVAGKMNQDQEKALEKWIQSPIKSCQAVEVIGGNVQTGTPHDTLGGSFRERDAILKGVDLGVLSSLTKGSLWVGERSGLQDFAVLSGAA